MKKFLIVLVIVVFSLVCITIFKNLIIKSMVTTVASRITGAPVHMDRFELNILNSTIHISGFKMYNPGGFPEGILVSCPKIKVIYDRATLFKQKRHLLIVDIELKEMQLTKNKEGKLNVDSLKIVQQPQYSSPTPMQIDLFTLSIGKILYKDCTIGTEPSMRIYDVNKHKSYKDILTAQQLALLVLAEPMKSAAIKNADICGVTLVKGVTVLPDAVAETFIGKDSVQQNINASFEHVYEISLQEIKRIGTIIKHDASSGVIKANINEAMVSLILKKGIDNKTEITISARKYMLPQLDIAAWVLYQIIDTLQDTIQ
ncbi:MAG: hypothetical protein PHU96_00460 [Candidatus Omnitrophica bacterium]|nr:hypothetical protein [Candidatus Omnitrophota bacterium]